MEIRVTFPGGTRVDAEYKGFEIRTDQPRRHGGEDSAPAPFDYFLASLATCAGLYVSRFLESRKLAADGLSLMLTTAKDPQRKRLSEIVVTVNLPESFPKKYSAAIVRAVDQCTVKRVILDPPAFRTVVRIGSTVAA
jgi:ribosomal protein S12 methylthiotransferase accessory factor